MSGLEKLMDPVLIVIAPLNVSLLLPAPKNCSGNDFTH